MMSDPTPSARVRLLARALLVLGVLGNLAAAAPAHAQRDGRRGRDAYRRDTPRLLAAFEGVVAGAARSTVRVRCDDNDVALGTIVGADGWVLTKASELKGDPVCRLPDGREVKARVVGVHEATDLALLRVEAKGLTPVVWQPSKDEPAGNWVAAPGTVKAPVAVGVVSVPTRKLSPREVARGKIPPGGFLGIGVEADDDGVRIIQVVPRSAAARAGLKVDDRILSIAGKSIDSADTVARTLRKTKPGETVRIRVRRDDEDLELKAKLDRRPNIGPGEFQNRLGSELSGRRAGFPVVLQHDLVLKPSDCGGPLVDLDGKVIGINIARSGRTESLAIPTEAVLPLLEELKSGKLAPKPGREGEGE